MRVVPTGQAEVHDGNQFVQYGRNMDSNNPVAVWYARDFQVPSGEDVPAWSIETDAEWKVSISVDTFLVPTPDTLYAIDRTAMTRDENFTVIDGVEQFVARADDPFVKELGDPNDYLRGSLYIESGNQVDEGYHRQRNEA